MGRRTTRPERSCFEVYIARRARATRSSTTIPGVPIATPMLALSRTGPTLSIAGPRRPSGTRAAIDSAWSGSAQTGAHHEELVARQTTDRVPVTQHVADPS